MTRSIISIIKQQILIVFSLLNRAYSIFYRKEEVEQVISNSRNATFFGYHDKTPFSADGSKILAMSIEASDRKPESECTPMKLGYFAKNEVGELGTHFTPFAQTTTWCFQQGCMLQWHPLYPNSRVIFNTLVNGQYGSIVYYIEKQEVISKYNQPIYSIDPNGCSAATLNFARLGRLRPGYGYGLLPDTTEGIAAPSNDGLLLLDLETGKTKMLVSLEKLALENGNPNDEHYINHPSFSPDGKKLVFFHIWLTEQKKRKIRFCYFDLQSNSYQVLEQKKIVSHFCWINASQILASTKAPDENMKLTIYDLEKENSEEIFDLPNGDTHPMRSPINENLFILDSYPDKLRDQHLFLFDLQTKNLKKIASFYSPFKYRGQVRCDLHPRWDREGKYVVVDSARDDRRKMFLINVHENST
jgi:hypothetical protein